MHPISFLLRAVSCIKCYNYQGFELIMDVKREEDLPLKEDEPTSHHHQPSNPSSNAGNADLNIRSRVTTGDIEDLLSDSHIDDRNRSVMVQEDGDIDDDDDDDDDTLNDLGDDDGLMMVEEEEEEGRLEGEGDLGDINGSDRGSREANNRIAQVGTHSNIVTTLGFDKSI